MKPQDGTDVEPTGAEWDHLPPLPTPTDGQEAPAQILWSVVLTARFEAHDATGRLTERDLKGGERPSPADARHLREVAEYMAVVAEWVEQSAHSGAENAASRSQGERAGPERG